MAKSCPKCGAQLEDNATFCTSCGVKLTPTPAPKKACPLNGLLKKYNPLVLGGVVLAAIVALVLVFSLLFPSPKVVARKYASGLINGNAKKVVSCLPKFWFEDSDEKKEYIEDLADFLEDLELKEYDKVKFEIKDVHTLSKSERKQLENKLESYEDDHDGFDADSINVKKARIVEIKVTIKDGGETYRRTFDVLVVKYKGQWKILTEPTGILSYFG